MTPRRGTAARRAQERWGGAPASPPDDTTSVPPADPRTGLRVPTTVSRTAVDRERLLSAAVDQRLAREASPAPVPTRITRALDLRELDGPEVDLACGVEEPAVDLWEAGELVPTRGQMELLAKLTGFPLEYFYAPVEPETSRAFLCGTDGLTVSTTVVDERGVQTTEFVEQPKRSRKPKPAAPPAGPPDPGKPHRPVRDRRTPSVCAVCELPVANRRHRL